MSDWPTVPMVIDGEHVGVCKCNGHSWYFLRADDAPDWAHCSHYTEWKTARDIRQHLEHRKAEHERPALEAEDAPV